MLRMAVGHSGDIDPEDAIAAVLDQCEQALSGERAKAGLLFSTYGTAPELLVSGVMQAHPDLELVGSTASGEMSSTLGFQEDSVVLALFASDTVDMTAGLGTGLSADPQGAARRAVEEARSKTDQEPRLCVTVPSVVLADPGAAIQCLRSELGKDVPILGGGSAPQGGSADMLGAFQFCNDRVVHDAVPILLFSGPLVFSFGVDTGWRPVGRRARVTRASGGVVHEIDGKPALALYEHYLGPGVEPTPANPLAVFEDESEDFYLRVPRSFDRGTGAIDVAGDLPQGAAVQLTVAVTDEIFDGARSAVTKAIKGYPGGSKPEAALIFSCAIRKLILGTRAGTELEIARNELGVTVPVCGFYGYGEIAPIESGAARFHNETMVAVLLGAP